MKIRDKTIVLRREDFNDKNWVKDFCKKLGLPKTTNEIRVITDDVYYGRYIDISKEKSIYIFIFSFGEDRWIEDFCNYLEVPETTSVIQVVVKNVEYI